MPQYVRTAGVWRTVTTPSVRTSGVWRTVKDGYVRTGGVWRQYHVGILTGDSTLGYFGLVPAASFITGSALASAVGLSAGTLQYDTTDWVKMSVDGKTVLFPQKPIRHTLSWDSLSAANVVIGAKTITVQGVVYKVRLFKGANANPQVRGSDGLDYGYNIESVRQSEWNRLMYPIHSTVHTDASNNNAGSYPFGTLAQFSDSDLLTHYSFGNGTYNWFQEVSSYSTSDRVGRGTHGVSYAYYTASSFAPSSGGWRPLLEAV